MQVRDGQSPQHSTIARINSIKYVAGKIEPIAEKIQGIVSRGKMNPEKKTDGIMKTMVICSA